MLLELKIIIEKTKLKCELTQLAAPAALGVNLVAYQAFNMVKFISPR